jgi:predicted PurR-regulated permease PerM
MKQDRQEEETVATATPQEPLAAPVTTSDVVLEERFAARLLDVLIRAGLVLAMLVLVYRVFSPFLTLTVWALILAVTLYPLNRLIARRVNGRQGIAAILLVLVCIGLLVVPIAVLMNSLGDTIQDFIARVQTNAIEIPPPPDHVATWPLVGAKLHATWSRAHDDLPGLVQGLQPKIGELAKAGLAFVASIAGALLLFLGSFILAGIFMAFGESAAQACQSIFQRLAGKERGEEFTNLSAATIRAVAQGVVGVALIQAILVGLCLLIAGVPWAGALAAIVLVLGIAQVPAVIVTLPAIAYIWTSGDYESVAAIIYTILLLVAGMADNVLKPLMLGRGVDVPMPVILVGALGGMAAAGIVGMFVGATLLALAYQLFKGWVADNRN